MPKIALHNRDGSSGGTVDLDDAVFDVEVNVPAMHQVVTAQLAAARAGTSKTKSRGEVRGGGRKPWSQKGTGRARQGSIRSPQWSGGGVAHGPTGEQNHVKRVNKKLKRVALRSALSDRARSGDIRVVDDLVFDAPRTKDALAFLDALEIGTRRALIVLASPDQATGRSFRNLGRVHLLTVDQLNTYDVLVSDVVIFQRTALEHIGKGSRPDLGQRGRRPSAGSRSDDADLGQRGRRPSAGSRSDDADLVQSGREQQ